MRGLLVLVLAVVLFLGVSGGDAGASADVQVTWTQERDCEYAHRWELEVDGVPFGDLEGVCGGPMIAVVTVSGVGPKGFKLRARTVEGIVSSWSNEVTANIPFAAPTLVEVSIP